MTDLSARIAGIGSYLPERILTNDEISAMVDTSDSWIRERTGIRQRHIAGEGVTTCDLAERAARRALEDAGFHVQRIEPAGQYARLDFLASRALRGHPRSGRLASKGLRAVGGAARRMYVPSGSLTVVATAPH